MKKITSSQGNEIAFHVNGAEFLHLSSSPVVINDEDAGVVLDRLGSQVLVVDATEEDITAYAATLQTAAPAPAQEPAPAPVVASDAPKPINAGDQTPPPPANTTGTPAA